MCVSIFNCLYECGSTGVSDWKKALLVSAYQFAQRLVPGREHLDTKPAHEFLLL